MKYEEQWKNAIRKYNLKGLNYISENGLNLKRYGLKHGFPRNYILGKDNVIVSLGAPNASSSKLTPILEELIKTEKQK